LAAPSDQLIAPERRQWSLREAAMLLVLRADGERADRLRMIGQQLVETARRSFREAHGEVDDAKVEQQIVQVRAWASGLDRSTYRANDGAGGVYIQSMPPDDIVKAMEDGNEDLQSA